jgi:photosystem II stability/assembly factor-like uncharacterized protein
VSSKRSIAACAAVAIAAVALMGCGSSSKTAETTTTGGTTATSAPTTASTSSATSTPSVAATTTTDPYPWKGEPVMSATFVSAQRGWALEANGRSDPTFDGGKSWGSTGAVDLRQAPPTRLRFADATHGFIYNRDAVYASTDGGASYPRLSTPFSNVYDLEISRGVVYVVAFESGDAHFRIWSSPADTIAWHEDPLRIAPGAGPVPSIQLVFSGGRGWLMEVNRLVTAGAQMSATGQWSAWTPPCAKVNGPAELTASTSKDLVAVCDEGVWGPPKRATAVYFSHDGGVTFQRHAAPIYGLVASPTPDTAVVVYGDTWQRTTDGGVTWNVVADLNQNHTTDAKDFGFTTPTQGFAILGNGLMAMTRDAGATWRQVIRP